MSPHAATRASWCRERALRVRALLGEKAMVQDSPVDPARIERLERRLQVLEDAEPIRT